MAKDSRWSGRRNGAQPSNNQTDQFFATTQNHADLRVFRSRSSTTVVFASSTEGPVRFTW